MKQQNNSLTIRIEDLLVFESLTERQNEFFSKWDNHEVQVLYGSAGTGKTFISFYKAIEEVLDKGTHADTLVILRSAVPSRDIGHLPGDIDEKGAIYELPYVEMCATLFNRTDAYTRLKEKKVLQFALTSFVRGITFDNAIILVDEVQNMNYQELYSVMTRVGYNSKIVFCGDFKQTDIRDGGLNKFMSVLKLMPNVAFYEFKKEDIVRSDIVKQFIVAEEQYECKKM